MSCEILIIDDDTEDAEILADAFKTCGLNNVDHVHSAGEAYKYLEGIHNDNELPALVITDNLLPGGITGTEFLSNFKKSDRYGSIPVIVLSSSKSEQEIERYRKMGAMDYLSKPFSYEEYLKIAAAIKEKVFRS